MSKYIDLELALNELLRLYEEDVERYGVEIRCGLKTPKTFDYRRAREALSDLPTIEVSEDCISREQFREQMYHRCFEVDNDPNMQKWESGNWLRYKLFEEELEKAPSIY